MALFRVSNERAQFDAAGNDARDQYGAGIRFTQGGNARVTTGSPTNYNQGIPMSATGQVAIVDATAGLPAGTIFHNGLPISGDKVCVSRNATAVVSNGTPYDSAGAVAADINLDLNFIGTDTLNPSVTFTRASSATFTGSNGLIQSATTNTPRFDYDPVTLAAKGLLIEEQRTNLLTYSDDFASNWTINACTRTPNATIAPDGSNTGVLFTALGNNSTNRHATLTVNATSVTYTVYVKRGNSDAPANLNFFGLYNAATAADLAYAIVNYATGAVTLTGPQAASSTAISQTLPNGWFRIGLTINAGITAGNTVSVYLGATGGLNTAGNTFYAWGAQLEAGSFATSYIPTVASQVTRAADVASVNTLSPWYNAAEGTLYAEYTPYAVTADSRFASIDDGTTANRIMLYGTASSARTILNVRTSGVDQADLQALSTYTTNTTKTAGAYKVNDFAFSVNGAAALTDTSGSIPAVTQLVIGGAGGSTSRASGHIRRISYYPRKLSSTELQALTA